MKRVEYLKLISDLFSFKTIFDDEGNEYVLFAQSPLSEVQGIQDRTAFEACENHVHLINNLKKNEFDVCIGLAVHLAESLLNSLRINYPIKQFVVFVSLRLNDSMVIRFHQKWENEAPYYNPDDFNTSKERVIKLET